jgi:hypothetical protein
MRLTPRLENKIREKILQCPELGYEKELLEEIDTLRMQIEVKNRKSVSAVMDLFYALREIDGSPTLKDLVKLAKRIKKGK